MLLRVTPYLRLPFLGKERNKRWAPVGTPVSRSFDADFRV